MIPQKRAPPRRPPPKQPMSSAQQMQYLGEQQVKMARMLKQQARDRRTYIMRAIFLFATLTLITGYGYYAYGIIVALTVLVGGWLMGWLEVLQIGLAWVLRNAGQPNFDELLRRADIMSEPVKEKESVSGENEFLEYGSSSMQGWRRSMEDAHTLLLLEKGGFFGVYDGHSGAATAKYCGEYMFQFVHQTKAFMKGEISKALYDGFIAIDKYLHSLPNFERGGCAAVVLYLDGDDVYCANAGDSRCVMCRNGSVDALSTDHKPFLPAEQMRIERAGCYVLNRRVNGMLALSRAIGDFMFKTNLQVSWEMQAVTSAPEVRVTKLNRDKDEFAVLACDGIWDTMSSKQVVDFVRPRIQERVPLEKICEELMDACLSPQPFRLGCDNMSVVIVKFKRGPQGSPHTNQAATTCSSPRVPFRLPAASSSVADNDSTISKEDENQSHNAVSEVLNGVPSTPPTVEKAVSAAEGSRKKEVGCSETNNSPSVSPKLSSSKESLTSCTPPLAKALCSPNSNQCADGARSNDHREDTLSESCAAITFHPKVFSPSTSPPEFRLRGKGS
ncbi:protein phosphatase 2C, putative [Leishmania tarentolae]|uniref:protein-serine/threonine phosphatase n=1 Tax=Leishmania tarentolae TaxID=5689 RepID=A0A640KVD7_LEITA|nr:protein phosphatase 2C, putative [Leishmania tarentolae]